ncbi:hypothetical protein LINPERPRIM_LOCUS2096 [Linum perenne]
MPVNTTERTRRAQVCETESGLWIFCGGRHTFPSGAR